MFKVKDLFSKKQVVGLDIGSSSLKLVEILDTSKGYFLNKFSQIPLDRSVIVDGALNEPETLSQKIKDLFKASRCRTKNVIASLSGHSVIVKKVSFTNMEENELRELISDEAEKYLPFDDMKEVNFDFQILGESDVNPNLIEVLLVAAKKTIIDSYSDAIGKAGLNAVIMDVDSFALETMYETNYDFEEGDIVVLVNIGASMTNINVVKNGFSVFTRDFPMGGNSITEVIQEKMGVTFEEAEAAKIEAEKINEAEESGSKEDLINYADPLFLEIERSVDYFGTTYPGELIKKMIISGGCAKLPGLVSTLSQRLNIEAEAVNPFKNISYNEKSFDPTQIKDISPMAAVGVGLALRRIDDK
ncbi:MAG: type IV pilus assembly protein PilM [Thermodesulfobacteriota bacterium]|nr:type IV pilus assembly protein PilM [Thermodesulfobacteriota bacterium]